jgi:cytoskeletal protein CcmA (bactofilin family)
VTKLNQHALDKAEKRETTAIFKGISVVGDVKGSHNIYLNGEFDGKMDLTALLLVGKTGKFKGQVKAECVIIEGEAEGKVIAKEKVELRDTGKYKGEIVAPSVMISDKAFFDGNVKMTKEEIEKPEMSLVEKAKSAAEEVIE